MNCLQTKRKMSAFLDGELAAPERDAFFEHLQGCSECCDRMGEASYHEATLAVTLKQRIEAPVAIRRNVMAAISRENARRAAPAPSWFPGLPRLSWRPAAAFATALALVGAGWRTFSHTFQPGPVFTVEAPAPARPAPPAPAIEAPAPAAPAPAEIAPRPAVDVAPAPASAPAPVLDPPRPVEAVPAPTVERGPAAPKPAPEPSAPVMIASVAPDQTVGTVSYVWAPDNVMNGRFLSRPEAGKAWEEASYDLGIRTHLQTTESTVIEMTLKDGTHLKSNENTEFVVQRAPTREDASWGIRLVKGDLWVRGAVGVDVEIIAPGVSIRGEDAEFSVRSFDGQDATVMVVSGEVECRNPLGRVDVGAGSAAVSVAGESPHEPFPAAELSGHLEWAYRTKQAYNALDNGVMPH